MASEERDRLIANLRRLHLSHAANDIDDHLRRAKQLEQGHLAFLASLVEAEVLARNETGTQRRLDRADFPELCRIQDFDFSEQPALDRKAILDLAELGFIDRCEAVLFMGPSGVGKTHLSIALGIKACEAGYDVLYTRAQQLLARLYASLADDTLEDVLEVFAKPDLLIVDELGNSPRKHEHDYAGVFFELVARRHRRGAIALTTNFGFDEWPEHLGSQSQLTPAIDRLVEGAHIFSFPSDAPSFRAKRKKGPGPLPPTRKRRRRSKAEACGLRPLAEHRRLPRTEGK